MGVATGSLLTSSAFSPSGSNSSLFPQAVSGKAIMVAKRNDESCLIVFILFYNVIRLQNYGESPSPPLPRLRIELSVLRMGLAESAGHEKAPAADAEALSRRCNLLRFSSCIHFAKPANWRGRSSRHGSRHRRSLVSLSAPRRTSRCGSRRGLSSSCRPL